MESEIFLNTCQICHRVYTKEYSYNRHIKYCYRAQSKRKGRPASCAACSNAKVKCSFVHPCARCVAKGLECNFDRQGQKRPAAVTGRSRQLSQPPVAELQPDQRPDQVQWPTEPRYPVEVMKLCVATRISRLDDLFDPLSVVFVNPEREMTSCETAQFGIQLNYPEQADFPPQGISVSEQDIANQIAARDLTHLQYMSPTRMQAAKLISHVFLAFPQMMLRRQTFPPFIHPHWHKPALPEIIANCMSIAQLFVARTPETRPFLWRTISTEFGRFRDEFMSMDAHQVQMAVQSMMIYIIMAIIDNDSETPRRAVEMITIIRMICMHFRNLLEGENYSNTELTKRSETWDDWVFAESRRRVTCLWFVISQVVSFETEIPCDGCGALEDLPICTSKTLWEARTLEEWQFERALYEASGPIVTLGELSAAQGNPGEPMNSRKLQHWEAGADKMAVMMNIATEFF